MIKDFEDCIDSVRIPAKINKKDFLVEGTFPIISQEEDFINGYWNNESDVIRIQKPVVVFGDHTKIFKYIDFDFVQGADGVKVLSPKDFLLPKYFYYQLLSLPLESLGYARHYKMLKEQKIYVPNKEAQLIIIEQLDRIFERIKTAKENIEKQELLINEFETSILINSFKPETV